MILNSNLTIFLIINLNSLTYKKYVLKTENVINNRLVVYKLNS